MLCSFLFLSDCYLDIQISVSKYLILFVFNILTLTFGKFPFMRYILNGFNRSSFFFSSSFVVRS